MRADWSGIGVRLCRSSAGEVRVTNTSGALAASVISMRVRRSGSKRSLFVFLAAEQSELRRIARGLGKAEMAEGVRGQQTPARGALQIAALDQKRLDDVLDRIARLRQGGSHGLDADRAAAVLHRAGRDVTPVQ